LWSGLFGSGTDAVSKAKNQIKDHPAAGYRALATAYETKGDTDQAISALQSYLLVKKKDANAWTELGGLETSQAQTVVAQYQSAQQAAQLADPSAPFQPGGTLAQAVGTNPAYQGAAQQASAQTSTLYQQAITKLSSAENDYKKAARIHPRDVTAQLQLASAAEQTGDSKTAIAAFKRALKINPHSPQNAQIKAQLKQLQAPPPTVKSSGGKQSKSGK
jgi:tetratricopeptide (TPR) repeat protein